MALMKVEDFTGPHEVVDETSLESVLLRTHGGRNCFWLTPGAPRFPHMAILVAGEQSHVSYFPRDGHPGFVSSGRTLVSDGAGSVRFFLSPTETIEVSNRQVVTFAAARRAATELLHAPERPSSLDWDEL